MKTLGDYDYRFLGTTVLSCALFLIFMILILASSPSSKAPDTTSQTAPTDLSVEVAPAPTDKQQALEARAQALCLEATHFTFSMKKGDPLTDEAGDFYQECWNQHQHDFIEVAKKEERLQQLHAQQESVVAEEKRQLDEVNKALGELNKKLQLGSKKKVLERVEPRK